MVQDRSVNKIVVKFARQSGTTSIQATGDYSTGVVAFTVAPTTAEVFVFERLLVQIVDAGANVDGGDYGNIGSGLTNGIGLEVQGSTGNTILDLCDGEPVKTNGDYGRFAYDWAVVTGLGAGNNYVHARWTFGKSGVPIRVDGQQSETINVLLNDSCTGLEEHTFMFQGYDEKSFN